MLALVYFIANVFIEIGIWLEDWASLRDPEFLDELRRAMDEPPVRTL